MNSSVQYALSSIQDEQISNSENRAGFYRAIVVNNKDQSNLGRVQIRIPSFHGSSPTQSFYISDDNLPYAYPASMDGAGNQMGQYLMPLMGSLVWVSFEAGTDNFIYFGGVYTAEPTGNRYIYFDRSTNSGEPKQITEDDIPSDYDPNKYVLFRSPKGAVIEFDDRDRVEQLRIADTHGNMINMNPSGISISSEEPLKANYPYTKTYYADYSFSSTETIHKINKLYVYSDTSLRTQCTPEVGSKISFVKGNECKCTSIVVSSSNDGVLTLSNNGTNEGGGTGKVVSYNDLTNLPTINMNVLKGNRDLAETPLTNKQIEDLLK